MEPFDTFESVNLAIGCEVMIRTPGDGRVIGVVEDVDPDARSVTFRDGRTYAFPEEVEP